jgi:hypothetical protein
MDLTGQPIHVADARRGLDEAIFLLRAGADSDVADVVHNVDVALHTVQHQVARRFRLSSGICSLDLASTPTWTLSALYGEL